MAWITDERIAEIHEIAAQIGEPYQTALTDLLSALAEARRDGERLDWLEAMEDGFANIDRISSVRGRFNDLPTLRAAIDAAITPPKDQP